MRLLLVLALAVVVALAASACYSDENVAAGLPIEGGGFSASGGSHRPPLDSGVTPGDVPLTPLDAGRGGPGMDARPHIDAGQQR